MAEALVGEASNRPRDHVAVTGGSAVGAEAFCATQAREADGASGEESQEGFPTFMRKMFPEKAPRGCIRKMEGVSGKQVLIGVNVRDKRIRRT